MNRYSFIKPREKKLFRLDSQIWVLFLFLVSSLYIVVQIIFVIMKGYIEASTIDYIERKNELDQKIYVLEENIKLIKAQEELHGKIIDRNKIVADSVSSLFELVPDSIYLTETVIHKDKLILKGFTPSKEVYNYMLLPPLKSIFSKTKTGFFPRENGWYSFVSESSSEKESIYEKN